MDQHHLSALIPEIGQPLYSRGQSLSITSLHTTQLWELVPNPYQDIGWYYSANIIFLALFSYFPMHTCIFKMLVLLPRALLLLHLFVICITLLKSPANTQCKPLLWHYFFTLSPYYREKKKDYLNQENNFCVLILKLQWNLNKSGKGHLFTLRQEFIWS